MPLTGRHVGGLGLGSCLGDIGVEVKSGGEVVVPVVAGDRTYVDRGLAQVAGREVGARLIAERA